MTAQPTAQPTARPAPEVGLAPDDARVMLTRQRGILEMIARAAPLQDVLTQLLASLETLMDGARCSVLLLDREHGTLHHGAAPTLPAAYVAAIDGLHIGDGQGSCGTAAAVNAPVVATDVRSDARWAGFRGLALDAGLRSCWSTPIAGHDGHPVGTFAVYHARPHRPTAREQLLVDRFTHLASVAIDHARVLGDLVSSEERFRRTFDDNPLGMVLLRPDGTIDRSNRAFSALAGCGGSLVGRRLADLLAPVEGRLADRLDELGPDRPGPVRFEGVVSPAGPGRPQAADLEVDVEVEVTVSLLCAAEDGPARHVVNVLDLTERRAAERDRRARSEAETARRTAEELTRAKSALLAAVGHEARTPIQAIVGFTELLGTLDLEPARRREALEHIDAAAGHVMDLLTDVLDLSRLETQVLPLALERVELREVVREAVALLTTKASARSFTVVADVGPQVVLADRRRLRQVLLNLLVNAIRHGRVGGRVVVRSVLPDDTATGGEKDLVVVTVTDDGPGIALEVLPRLFTPFASGASAPAAGAAQDESLGLGLGLAHGLLHAMGGDLRVSGTGPGGTTMTLRVPRADDGHDAAPPTGATAPVTTLAGAHAPGTTGSTATTDPTRGHRP
ncbi:ATP-binding protein [Nocardioides sp. CFH 31398]|uniref:sensor histidine kinase n=1 Tax=Nocardioides sp. CFH 31398 TaxID=2919579 RepID=UPI001F05AE23|nr:ATP-binding protein [Nocardioides sp. CFH 31398]MCH1865310.1 ATP-binding protein [Nocardioides sp. CFH 31398]